jgi:Zn-dependent peptidase ImmA (M78 family)
MLDWAARRSRRDRDELAELFPLEAWETGQRTPTLKQLEKYAKATYTPFGMFFLDSPPAETLPLPDFRTIAGASIDGPSADLLDVIAICERRQTWFADFAHATHREELAFVGSLSTDDDPLLAAQTIRDALGFTPEARKNYATWEEALRRLIEHAENLGILVMISGVVGSNTHRGLSTAEFRGFAMADPVAPLIFINNADAKAAQNFTVAHELAHIWLGETGISDVTLRAEDLGPVERWCNRVAAEILVPSESFRTEYRPSVEPRDEAARLARFYKVSAMVILRRAFEVGFLDWDTFTVALAAEEAAAAARKERNSGEGNFYNTLGAWVGKSFARAVVADTLEGRTLYRDAFELLGLRKAETFDRLREELGVR